MGAGRFSWVVLVAVCVLLTLAAWRTRHEATRSGHSGAHRLGSDTGRQADAMTVAVEIFEAGKEPQRREVLVPLGR